MEAVVCLGELLITGSLAEAGLGQDFAAAARAYKHAALAGSADAQAQLLVKTSREVRENRAYKHCSPKLSIILWL